MQDVIASIPANWVVALGMAFVLVLFALVTFIGLWIDLRRHQWQVRSLQLSSSRQFSSPAPQSDRQAPDYAGAANMQASSGQTNMDAFRPRAGLAHRDFQG
jgi:type II secretory pathway component PulL